MAALNQYRDTGHSTSISQKTVLAVIGSTTCLSCHPSITVCTQLTYCLCCSFPWLLKLLCWCHEVICSHCYGFKSGSDVYSGTNYCRSVFCMRMLNCLPSVMRVSKIHVYLPSELSCLKSTLCMAPWLHICFSCQSCCSCKWVCSCFSSISN